MIHVGFNIFVVNWIMECVSSVIFSILINGSTFKFFKKYIGLRQGCHLAPLLFLLIVEGLSREVMEAKIRWSIDALI